MCFDRKWQKNLHLLSHMFLFLMHIFPAAAMQTRTDSHRYNGAGLAEDGHNKGPNTASSSIIGQQDAECNRQPPQSDAQDELLRSVPTTEEDGAVTSLPDTGEWWASTPEPVERWIWKYWACALYTIKVKCIYQLWSMLVFGNQWATSSEATLKQRGWSTLNRWLLVKVMWLCMMSSSDSICIMLSELWLKFEFVLSPPLALK